MYKGRIKNITTVFFMKCFNCNGAEFREVPSTSMGSLLECVKCGLRTAYGASGQDVSGHPKPISMTEALKEAKEVAQTKAEKEAEKAKEDAKGD